MAKDDFPVLERLGPVPYWRGELKCMPELRVIYRKARDAALKRLAVDAAKDVNEAKVQSGYRL